MFGVPLQRNFDGGPLRQALMAQRERNLEAYADSTLWAERAGRNAKLALARIGDETYEAVMDRFSNQWFESRTWRAQAEAYGRLLDAPAGATVAELVATFGEADLPPICR
jgi:hypothetical protein